MRPPTLMEFLQQFGGAMSGPAADYVRSVGQKIAVRIEGLDESFAGELTGIDPRVDPATRLVALRGSVANAGGKLTPGQFVRIKVELPAETGVIALPQTTVSASLYGDYVYIVRPKEGAEPPAEGSGVKVSVPVLLRAGCTENKALLSLAAERWQSVQPFVVPTEPVVWGKCGLKAWPE